ncbi:hypothetical protein GWK47_031516 [Chionoecetes opilio]|uniref:Uncharacterized protein n=1 Tax=Chionoecetes opilio TaxID=41210 RepID=A0A8J4YQZ0_CHIOP|nr:hypothetical protein GWK47_031516 [Chionoecetes opilio]
MALPSPLQECNNRPHKSHMAADPKRRKKPPARSRFAMWCDKKRRKPLELFDTDVGVLPKPPRTTPHPSTTKPQHSPHHISHSHRKWMGPYIRLLQAPNPIAYCVLTLLTKGRCLLPCTEGLLERSVERGPSDSDRSGKSPEGRQGGSRRFCGGQFTPPLRIVAGRVYHPPQELSAPSKAWPSFHSPRPFVRRGKYRPGRGEACFETTPKQDCCFKPPLLTSPPLPLPPLPWQDPCCPALQEKLLLPCLHLLLLTTAVALNLLRITSAFEPPPADRNTSTKMSLLPGPIATPVPFPIQHRPRNEIPLFPFPWGNFPDVGKELALGTPRQRYKNFLV